VWLDVLVEAGPEIAAAKLAEMPLPQIVAGFAHHVRVFDVSAVSSYETTDGEIWDYSRPVRDVVGCEIGGFHVAATRAGSWDAIVAVLAALDSDHQDRFVELMRAVRSRSHSRREADGFHSLLQNRDQMMFDVSVERGRRRAERGFASPADARAFLQMSRHVRPATVVPNPIAREYFRSIECSGPPQGGPSQDDGPSLDDAIEIADLLTEAGIAPLEEPRGLLTSGDVEGSSSRIQRCMQVVAERDAVAYGERNFELAYLANVLISGCSIQGHPFTPKEGADGAVAICNLGLERLDDPSPDYLITHDLIGVFQIGWTVLHEDVCVSTAKSFCEVLHELRVADDDLHSSLNLLRIRLLRAIDDGTPWRAAEALEVLTSLDLPAWAALAGLIAECPVIHGGLVASVDRSVHQVDATAFQFIAGPEQLALVRRFLAALPEILL
jgi:hypothetical protein